MDYIKVLDKGFVRIVDSMGSDLSVVNSARISLASMSEAMELKDEKLIGFLLREKHGCYDEETEVLTEEGWKFWPNVTGEESFATISKQGKIEYQKAQRLICKPVNEELVRIKGNGLDVFVTQDHNMWAKEYLRSSKQEYKLVSAKNLLTKNYKLSLGGGIWEAPEYEDTLSKIKLLGFHIGDGNFGTSLSFHLSKTDKIEYLTELTRDCAFSLTNNRENYYSVGTAKDSVFRNLLKNSYTENKEKCIPKEILSLGKQTLEALFEGLMMADGSVSSKGKRTYSTVSKVLADQLQELALKLGFSASIREQVTTQGHFGNKTIYCLVFYRKRNLEPETGRTLSARSKTVNLIQYKGNVYCVTVPNGTLYVRRNNKALWCGNSPFEHTTMTFHIKEPLVVARQHYKHRIGSYGEDSWNEMSGRYVEMKEEFHIPDIENIRTQLGKPGAYNYVPLDVENAKWFRILLEQDCIRQMEHYKTALERGVAKEQARFLLPINLYTEFYWTLNLRSLLNFCALRSQELEKPNLNAPAQWETRQYGMALETLGAQLFPVTFRAFNENNRVAP